MERLFTSVVAGKETKQTGRTPLSYRLGRWAFLATLVGLSALAPAAVIPTNGVITTVDENYQTLSFSSAGGDKQKAFGKFTWETFRMGFIPSGVFSLVGMLNDLPARVGREIDFSVSNWNAGKGYRVVVRQKSKTQLAYFDNNVNDNVAHYEAKMFASIYCIGAFVPTVLKASNSITEKSESNVAAGAENTSATKLAGPQFNMEITLTYDFPAGQKCVDGMLVKTQATGTTLKLDPMEISILELGAPL